MTPPKVIKKKNAEDKPSREATPPKKVTKEKAISVMLQGDASSENYKSIIKMLGGTIVNEIMEPFDVLVASQLKRSPKLL